MERGTAKNFSFGEPTKELSAMERKDVRIEIEKTMKGGGKKQPRDGMQYEGVFYICIVCVFVCVWREEGKRGCQGKRGEGEVNAGMEKKLLRK